MINSHLLLLLCNFSVLACADTLLETTLGEVKGFLYETTTADVIAEVFLNIPYAKPPVGDLRFEEPQPASPWSTPIDGTKFGACCIPHTRADVLPPAEFQEPDEDCLTLNVIRPQKEAPKGGFPILVWVHGGGYVVGSASLFGYKAFGNIYIPHDVVVVTVQYRIGVYEPNNTLIQTTVEIFPIGSPMLHYKLHKALAAKFVHDNAEMWGADNSRVSYWGISAGAAIVGQLAMSPHSRDYISGTIEMSGSATAAWARNPLLEQNSIELGKALGCNDLSAMKECMKTKTSEEIFNAIEKTDSTTDHVICFKYAPHFDGDFFPEEPEELIKNSRKVPTMIGVGSKEASFFTYMAHAQTLQKLYLLPEDIGSFSEKTLLAAIENKIARPEFYSTIRVREEAVKKLTEFYGNAGKLKNADYAYYLDEYTKIISDVMYNLPAADMAALKRDAGYPVYLYHFDHYNEAIWLNTTDKRLKGSPHLNEYAYLLEMFPFGKFDTTTGDEKIVNDILVQAVVSFVKTGAPTLPSPLIWPKLADSSMNHISITANPKIKRNFYQESTTFWNEMRALGFDLIRGKRISGRSFSDEESCGNAILFLLLGFVFAMLQ